ncbi:hypothetical protein GCM10011316_26980 [Roseibium aquae]|uniref:DUF2252 domain-containing protein n=1 Tax=Roseibium aquae TaxID=1323746 RepID=A0A916X160_9HYPH|nr:DUF2252 family protein [Roseibium aquae]GGB53555.1 hypothetical protein GCM10011316_26980 [Roseibium aquae]
MTERAERRQLLKRELQRIDGKSPEAPTPLTKHVKMAASPFHVLRGTAQVFYADLASGQLPLPAPMLEAPLTRIVGDCHLSNFGFFTEDGSYGDRVIWGPNDYDDAAEGHAAFDLSRFCVSLFLASDYLEGLIEGRYTSAEQFNGTNAPSRNDAAKAAKAFLKAYRKACEHVIDQPETRDWAVDDFGKSHFLAAPLKRAISRAPGGQNFYEKSSVGKLTVATDTGFRFKKAQGKLAAVEPDMAAELRFVFRPYLDDTILDVAQRLGAGTGSLNVERYYFLVGPDAGPSEAAFRETHIVEVKQQRPAAIIEHFPDLSPVNRMDPAHLTIDCQRRMMRRPDLVLDEVNWKGLHWLVRSRHHARVTVDPEELLEAGAPGKALKDYAKACGTALARTHGRVDRRSVRFESAMAEALEDFDKELIEVAREYAQVVRTDHRILKEMLGQDGKSNAA